MKGQKYALLQQQQGKQHGNGHSSRFLVAYVTTARPYDGKLVVQ